MNHKESLSCSAPRSSASARVCGGNINPDALQCDTQLTRSPVVPQKGSQAPTSQNELAEPISTTFLPKRGNIKRDFGQICLTLDSQIRRNEMIMQFSLLASIKRLKFRVLVLPTQVFALWYHVCSRSWFGSFPIREDPCSTL